MSVFTHRVLKTLDVPGTNGTVTFRKLAPRHLEAAVVEQQRQSMANVKDIGGPALLKEFMALGDKDKDAKASGDDAAPDPLAGYDKPTLIKKAVKSWTLEEPLSDEAIDELDEDTCDWLAREVMRLAKPKAFLSETEREDEQGNG